MVTAGILFGGGDFLAQKLFPEKENQKYDYYRTLRACTYGSVFFSPIAVLWYTKKLPFIKNPFLSQTQRSTWSSRTVNFCDIIFRVGVDQMIFPGFVWIPMYNIVMTTLALNETPLKTAKEKLDRNWWTILTTGWSIWPIFQFISFTIIPIHLRIVISNICSMGWNCFLSLVHNSKSHYDSHFLEEIHELDEPVLT